MQEQDYLEQEIDHARATNAEDVDKEQLLRALIYQLHEVQNNLYADVKKFSDASHEVMGTQKAFKESVKDLSLIAPELRRQIQDIIHTSVYSAIKSQEDALGKRIIQVVAGETSSLVKSLDSSIDDARRTLDRHKEESYQARWMYVITGAACGLFMTLGFVVYMMFQPFAFLDGRDVRLYESGKLFNEKVWPQLTEKEKKRIDDLSVGEPPKPTK